MKISHVVGILRCWAPGTGTERAGPARNAARCHALRSLRRIKVVVTGCQLVGAGVNQCVCRACRKAREGDTGFTGRARVPGRREGKYLVKVKRSSIGNQHADLIMHQHLRRGCESTTRGQRPGNERRVRRLTEGKIYIDRLQLLCQGGQHAGGIAINGIGRRVGAFGRSAKLVPKGAGCTDQKQRSIGNSGHRHTLWVNAAIDHQAMPAKHSQDAVVAICRGGMFWWRDISHTPSRRGIGRPWQARKRQSACRL